MCFNLKCMKSVSSFEKIESYVRCFKALRKRIVNNIRLNSLFERYREDIVEIEFYNSLLYYYYLLIIVDHLSKYGFVYKLLIKAKTIRN